MSIGKLDSISFADALEKALENAPVTQKREIVMLPDALGRVLAEDIVCRKNLPSFDNSAMDGFAVRSSDAGAKVEVAATIYAGDRCDACLGPAQCYRIMTGARVPEDADAVVPIEKCVDSGKDFAVLPDKIKEGDNLRRKGEEQKEGSILMFAGELLKPSHIAMLSAQGITAVPVFAPLSIAVVSTGDEIKEPWDEAGDDEIYNANAFGISSLLKKYGFYPSYIGAIPDNLQESIDFISNLKKYDAIITTGGISMGDADFLEEAFSANGLKTLFHGIKVKPGRPTMMGRMGEVFVMAMPGNPLTTLLNVFLLCVPVLKKMQGVVSCHHSYIYTLNRKEFGAKNSRSNLVLGKIENGYFHAVRDNRVGSGMLTPLMEADCVAVFEEGCMMPREKDPVKVILFERDTCETENRAYNSNSEKGHDP